MSGCERYRSVLIAVMDIAMVAVAFGGDVPGGRLVTPFNFSDPTVWRASDGRWLAMPSGMKPLLASVDLLTWTDAGFDILTEKTRSELVARTVGDRDPTFGGGFWAPDVAKVGDKWILTVTLYGGSFHKCTIVSLVADAPEGPFEDPRVLVDAKAAHIADSIDPEIVCDGDRTYLFFGSQDGIFRLELTNDARAPLPGAKPVHVAGYRSGWNRETLEKGRYHHYEGVYLHRRGEWWYMFASGGGFRDHTYRVVVARSKKLDGPFLDRDGKPIREGFATTILSSGKSDRFYGPGHNGEIFTKDGRDWMFYHVHDRRMPLSGKYAPRPMAVQEIRWDNDGWPYFKGGKPDLKDYSGFYRTERRTRDEWRVIDPQGKMFVPLGVEHCRLRGEGEFEKRMLAKFGDAETWMADAFSKLKDWNFTLFGGCCASLLYHRGIPHAIYPWVGEPYSFEGGDKAILKGKRRPGTAFPNVFNPGWTEYCREWTHKHFAPHRYDKDLFGWFFDNELAWWGGDVADAAKQGDYGLVDVVAALPPEHSARRAHDAFMAAHRGEWAETKCRAEFLREIAERYFGGIVSALREADPNHLILGCRFSGVWMEPEILEVAGKWCDVVSFNHYPYVDLDSGEVRISHREGAASQLVEERYAEMYRIAKKPFLVTEWSFPAMDAGLPCKTGEGMRTPTQRERAKASEVFAQKLMSIPFVIGYDYFMWHDSAGGSENCNYGLVNNEGEPYAELTEMFRRVQLEFKENRGHGK